MRTFAPALLAIAVVIGPTAGSALAQEPRPGGPGGREGRGPQLPLLTALDADGDGEVSSKEIENATAALKTLDKNKDGKLTRDEMFPEFRGGPGGPGGPNPREVVARMMTYDKNLDGKLSKDELPERMRPLLDRADANKDGFLDKAELERMADRQPGGGPGRGPEGAEPRERP